MLTNEVLMGVDDTSSLIVGDLQEILGQQLRFRPIHTMITILVLLIAY